MFYSRFYHLKTNKSLSSSFFMQNYIANHSKSKYNKCGINKLIKYGGKTMKKIISSLFVALLLFALIGCDKKEYQTDGEFTAFEVSLNYGDPQVTWVTVTIKDGKIKSFYIDERQTSMDDGVISWNAKTKKELGDEYGMIIASQIDKEWYEQAEAIEAKWLADGVDSIEVDDEGYIIDLAGATMIDAYSKLAKEALENAKAGKSIAFEVSLNYGAPQITWVEVTVSKGKATAYYIDEQQTEKTNDKYPWNAKTKKELGDEYGMIIASQIEKEWYEQAEAIEAKWLADGVDSIQVDDEGYIIDLAGATMIDAYSKLAKKALANVNIK